MSTILNHPVGQILQSVVNHLQATQWQAAEQLCTEVCAAYPNHADALHLLAIIYAQTQRYDLANEYFLQAITNAPTRADILANYGNLLYEQDDFEAVIHYCQQSLALDNASPEVHNTLGNALRQQGKLNEAIQHYRQAVALQGNYPDAHNNLGQALKTQNCPQEAERCFRKALQLLPDFQQAAANLAEVDSIWLSPIAGKQVCLHRYRVEDADFLWDCYHNAEFMRLYNRFMPHNASKKSLLLKLREEAQSHPCQTKSINWVINLKSHANTLRPIGIANLADIQWQHRRAEFLIGIPNNAERLTGVMTAVTLAVMDFAFNLIGLNKLITFVYGDNVPAQKNALAHGFKQEGFWQQHILHPEAQGFVDLFGNGLTQNDFRENVRIAKLSKRLLGRDITLITAAKVG